MVSDPIEGILAAAGQLFGELGIAGATMAGIATRAGLRQSSIYYYFANRDAIVAMLVERANVIPLELVQRIEAAGGSSGAMLHAFIRGDVEALCRLPFDINDIHRIAARDRSRFASYWGERERLERRLAVIIRAGVDDGTLRPVKPRLAALTILANDEGTQNWYRLGTRKSAREIARFLADLTVQGLLSDAVELADSVEIDDDV
jgi:TetR/AcrR family transcriptional regulator